MLALDSLSRKEAATKVTRRLVTQGTAIIAGVNQGNCRHSIGFLDCSFSLFRRHSPASNLGLAGFLGSGMYFSPCSSLAANFGA
jgi:hypothetical protein